jgi:GAF domain-containing protein
VISGLTSDFPAHEREHLEAQGILSLLVVPVFVGNRMWGFFAVDECRQERTWTVGEKEAFRAAAGILGAAVKLSRTGARG